MKPNRILSLLLAAALAASVTACGGAASSTAASSAASGAAPSAPAASSAVSAPAEEAAAPETAYPLTLTDQAGREVTLEARPERLVSGYYISTSLLVALGLEDSLVGIEAKAASRPIYARSAPGLLELPSVGTAKEFDLEGCLALEPDLVVLPLRLQDTADTLAGMGIPALVVNPEDQALLEEMTALLGAATDTNDRARALLDFTAEQQARLAGALAGAEKPSVYLAGNSSFLSTAGAAMYQSAMIELAGGVNAAAEIADSYWAEVSYEQVLAWDPACIVLASDAEYTVEDVLNDPNLAGCAAVESGRVYQIPGDAEAWDSPVPSGILGAVWLAGVLHPDECPAEEAAAVIDAFYESFYGFTYNED